LPSIQKFMVSQATNLGFLPAFSVCSRTLNCRTGSMLARKTYGESAQAPGSLGRKSEKTLSCVSSVVRVEKSGA